MSGGLAGLGGVPRAVDFGGMLASRLGRRHAAGAGASDVLQRSADVRSDGPSVLARYVARATTAGEADAVQDLLADVLARAAATGLTEGGGFDVAVPAACLGDGPGRESRLRRVCEAAAGSGAGVVVAPLDGEDAESVAALVSRLRADHPGLGLEVWSGLRTTAGDLQRVLDAATAATDAAAATGATEPPRLLLRARGEAPGLPAGLALPGSSDAEMAFVRYAKRVLRAPLRVSVAPGDATLTGIVEAIADGAAATAGSAAAGAGDADGPVWWEVVVDLGVRPDEVRRLLATGRRVRVDVPFGPRWRAVGLRRSVRAARGWRR